MNDTASVRSIKTETVFAALVQVNLPFGKTDVGKAFQRGVLNRCFGRVDCNALDSVDRRGGRGINLRGCNNHAVGRIKIENESVVLALFNYKAR